MKDPPVVRAVLWIRSIFSFLLIRDGRELYFVVFEKRLEDGGNVFVLERVLFLGLLIRSLLLSSGLLF